MSWENLEPGEQWEGFRNLPQISDHDNNLVENHIPLEFAEPVEEVRDDVPGLLQFRGDENPEVEWNIRPQTPEEEEQHAEPHTPPQQVLPQPRTPLA